MVTLRRFVFLFACATALADAPSFHLVRQATNDHINPIDEQLSRGIAWSHGGYIVIDQLTGQTPVFYSLDRDGNWTETAQIKDPEPGLFNVYGFDRQSNGTIVFSGATEPAPRVLSPFLAFTSADGKVQRLLHSDHYFPYQVAVAPDDSIWTLGFETENTEAHVLRHFNSAGNFIASALPQSKFNRYQQFCALHGHLVATRDRVAWYGSLEGKASYTEVSLDTMNMKEYPGVPSSYKYARAVGLAVTNDGFAAVSIQDKSPLARTNYVFDRASASWAPVSVPPMGGFKFAPVLIGSDERHLVFKYGQEAGFFSVSQ